MPIYTHLETVEEQNGKIRTHAQWGFMVEPCFFLHIAKGQSLGTNPLAVN